MIRDSEIYLIDFGMATAVSDDTLSKEQLHVVGTPTWMSYFVHDGYSPHYRDDLITVGYIYLSWYGVLPWIKMESSTGKMDPIIDYSDIRHPSHQMRKKYKTWLNIEMLCMNRKIRDFLYKLYHS